MELALIGETPSDEAQKLVFGENGTHFRLQGTYLRFNPYNSFRGTHDVKWNTLNDRKEYTFNPNHVWYVSNIFPSWETDGNLQGHASHRITPFLNLIGLDEKPSQKIRKNIVELKRTQPYNTQLGIINHRALRGKRTWRGIEKDLNYGMRGATTVNMVWDAFIESIVSIENPDNVYLPVGTILKVNDKANLWNSDGKLESQTIEWLEKNIENNYVVKDYPIENWMGVLPNRKKADIYPYYDKKVSKVAIPRKRKAPFHELRSQTLATTMRGGVAHDYELHQTLKNNTSGLKQRGDYYESIDVATLHHLIKKGYLTMEGRYGGKTELAQTFRGKKSSMRKKLLRGGHKFTYSDERPTPLALHPSL